jgi:hypothetical protein
MSAVATIQTPVAHSADDHLPAAEVLRRYRGLTRAKLYRLVVGNEVRAILPPGKTPRYSVADVERVMQGRGA